MRLEKRFCWTCGEEIPKYKRSDAKYCSPTCGNGYRKWRHYHNNPELYRRNRWEENSNIEKRMYSRIKSRAKKNNIPFDLEIDDIVVPEKCPILGIELDWNVGKGSGFHDNSPSLDKIYPKYGYVRGNVRVISSRANLLKSNATSEELEKILEDLHALGL